MTIGTTRIVVKPKYSKISLLPPEFKLVVTMDIKSQVIEAITHQLSLPGTNMPFPVKISEQ
jgi:hypothetical protein